MTITELLALPDALRRAERQVAALERIAAALEMMYPPVAEYRGSSPDDGTVEFAADDDALPEYLREEVERVKSSKDRDNSIAIVAGSDSF